jgi:predicted glycosyltransferase
MKIVHYCQHVLGVGHFFRSLEIARGLADHDVLLVSGGPEPEVDFPPHIRRTRLPGLWMDEEFSALRPVDPAADLEAIKTERTNLLLDVLQRERPDIFLVELFPFGRNAFRFELLPALARARELGAKNACSLRDILVEKDNKEKYERRTVERLNDHFDALLVHADPGVLTLDETFSRLDAIRCPVRYTGFVTPRPGPGARERLRSELDLGEDDRLLVASAGGGAVGQELLRAACEALDHLDGDFRLRVYAGTLATDDDLRTLAGLAQGRSVAVARFADTFVDLLAAADVSLSMAGYNTTLNVLAAGTRGLVWPFAQNREQRMRAERFAAPGRLEILETAELDPQALAERIRRILLTPPPAGEPIALDGAATTARLLQELGS